MKKISRILIIILVMFMCVPVFGEERHQTDGTCDLFSASDMMFMCNTVIDKNGKNCVYNSEYKVCHPEDENPDGTSKGDNDSTDEKNDTTDDKNDTTDDKNDTTDEKNDTTNSNKLFNWCQYMLTDEECENQVSENGKKCKWHKGGIFASSYCYESSVVVGDSVTPDVDIYGNVSSGKVNCDSLGLLRKDLNGAFSLFKIVAPILVIAMSAYDFIKAITSKVDGDAKKAFTKFVKRLIFAMILFFLPMILDFFLGLIDPSYSTCIKS